MSNVKNYYPVNLDLSGKSCLVVGGGDVAAQKARSLLECAANVSVVSPEVSPKMSALLRRKGVTYAQARYQARHLKGAFLVIAATNDPKVNQAVAAQARRQRIWVNVVDVPQLCDFIVPAVVRRGPLVVGVSTSGSSPVVAQYLKAQIEALAGQEYVALIRLLGGVREDVKARYATMAERRAVYQRILDSDVLDLLKRGKRAQAVKRVRRMVEG